MTADFTPASPTLSMQTIVSRMPSRWEPHGYDPVPEIPLVTAADVVPILPGIDVWDCWPLAHEDGRTVVHEGRTWWFFLSAPCFDDPHERHDVARIRLLSQGAAGDWRDHGNALPDGLNPGTREWAGSAVLMDDGVSVCLFYTVAGRRGGAFSYEQRLFEVPGRMGTQGPGHWGTPREIVVADGTRYVADRQEIANPVPGSIKAFRDPAWFRDPATGLAHIVFTGSAAWTQDSHNGLVGLATKTPQGWVLDDPLVEAIGTNNEMERPCVVLRDGLYYLFWSTQRHTFAPGALAGPNGLYGMVAPALTGPWRALNGGGLVAPNPAGEAGQTYSWWVTGEGAVWSFIDYWGMEGRGLADHPELRRAQFGGAPAPVFQLAFDGDRVSIVQ